MNPPKGALGPLIKKESDNGMCYCKHKFGPLHYCAGFFSELSFFLVAGVRFYFGFVMKHVDNTGVFNYCWTGLTEYQGLFCSSPYTTSGEAGGAQGIGKEQWPQQIQ